MVGTGSLWGVGTAGHDDEYDEGDDDGAVQATRGQGSRRTLGDRVRANAATRPTRPSTPPASARARIEGLEQKERVLSFAAAGLAAVMGVVVYLIQTDNHHFRLAKDQLTPQTTLLLGFLFAALFLGATLWGRRAPIGFVGLFAFLGFGLPEGIPFLALAVWLLFRSYKFQKEAAVAAKAATADRPGSSRSGPTPSGTSGTRAGSSRGAARGSASKAPARIEANKRYTPKRPAPPPPKPSRRDRKATKGAN
jgi:hypothetical protein